MGSVKNNTPPPVVSDEDLFCQLMTTPLMQVSDEYLDWAYQQDKYNSFVSKCIWEYEIERRKQTKKEEKQCSTQKQQ